MKNNMFEIFNETDEEIKEIKTIKKVLKYAIKKERLKKIEFNVIIVSNEYIKEINKLYRNKDLVTDVISFALEDSKDVKLDHRLLGDIYISLDRAKSQAIDYKHSLKRELSFLSLHGFLHLLGYDHMTKEEEKVMFNKQEKILNDLKIIK